MNNQLKYSDKTSYYKIFSIFLIIPFLALFISCQEDPSSLGSNLLPASDKDSIRYDTTLTFKSFVYKNKAKKTTNLSHYTIGIIHDDNFGIFKGEYIGQFGLTKLDTNIVDYTADSVMLYIEIDSIYGNVNESLSFDVYELSLDIQKDSSYYSNQNITDFYSAVNKINTNSYIRGDSLIAIPLSAEFAAKLKSNKELYRSDSAFKSVFKGVSIIPSISNTPGGAIYSNISSTNSRIVFYYHTDKDTSSINYLFSYGYRFGKYTYDYSSSTINNYLTNPENENDEYIFIQSLDGVSTKICFSNYKSWLTDDSIYSILNAELIIPVFKDANFELFYPPNKLSFIHYDDSLSYQTEDYSKGLFDGIYNKELGQYHFNISKHFMRLLKGDVKDSCLNFVIIPDYIKTTPKPGQAHRVILNSGESIKMKVAYTKH